MREMIDLTAANLIDTPFRDDCVGFDIAGARLLGFLREAVALGGSLRDWHVVFNMGTVVRLNLENVRAGSATSVNTNDAAGNPFDYDYFNSFPENKLPDNLGKEDIVRENIATWAAQTAAPGDIGRAVSGAFERLILDGYPEDRTDRVPIPIASARDPNAAADDFYLDEDLVWMVIWRDRAHGITNLAIADNAMDAAIYGGEARRFDYMMPRVDTVISPGLVLTKLEKKEFM